VALLIGSSDEQWMDVEPGKGAGRRDIRHKPSKADQAKSMSGHARALRDQISPVIGHAWRVLDAHPRPSRSGKVVAPGTATLLAESHPSVQVPIFDFPR
jgi:hypothetical protein